MVELNINLTLIAILMAIWPRPESAFGTASDPATTGVHGSPESLPFDQVAHHVLERVADPLEHLDQDTDADAVLATKLLPTMALCSASE